MFIERLELSGYRRFMTNDIHHLTYTPKSPFQLILGTNGSGKSSLLAELSPLPADSSAFIKQGHKKITIEHNGARYLLSSTFKGGAKHSFIKNDEELNPGGTSTVQKELVRREFGLWGDLHKLLTGRIRFTKMSPQQRRDWITLLSVADYSYAVGVFNKARSAARDRQGVVKHLKTRLTQETSNLSLLGSVDGVEETRQQLVDELNALLSERVPNLGSFKDSFDRLEQSLERLVDLNRLLQKYHRYVPYGYSFKNLEDIDLELATRGAVLSTMRDLIEKYLNDYTELEETSKKMAADEMSAPVNLYEEIERLEDSLVKAREEALTFPDIENAPAVLKDTQTILEGVVQLFQSLPDNSDRHLSKQALAEAHQKRMEQQQLIDRSTTAMMKIQRHLTLMRDASSNECPSCKYVWRPGYSEHEVQQHEQWLLDHQQVINAAELELKTLTTYFDEVEEYSSKCMQFRGFVSSYPRLKLLWDHILDNKILTDRPNEQTTIFYQWLRDVNIQATVHNNEERLGQLRRIAEQQQLGGTVALMERLGKLRHEIETLTSDITRKTTERRELLEYRNSMDKFVETRNEIERRRTEVDTQIQESLSSYRNKLIDETAQHHQVELAQIQQRLSNHTTLSGIVKDLDSSLSVAAIEHEAYVLISKALSPVDGLIAEQMIGFISCLVDQMNAIIKAIWTQDLTISACGIDSGELDYKFPVTAGEGNRSEDIEETSTAQTEVINFSFMLTVMLYLNLSEYPLYLDELGSGFDEQHRINVMQFVKQLMDVNRHPQLFMISHYVSSWGVFAGAQHLVLDPSNIAVPEGYNQHVILK